jgi:hypothetical protein
MTIAAIIRAHAFVACSALLLAAALAACPGPQPEAAPEGTAGAPATTSTGGAEGGGGSGGGGTGGGGGGGAGTCGNGTVDPGELCFHPVKVVSGGSNVGVGKIIDLDDDGDLDIAGLGTDHVFYEFLANPKGTFAMPKVGPSGIYVFRLGTFTVDSLPDAVAKLTSNEVGLLVNDGAGDFAPPVTFATHSFINSFVAGHIDDDGLDDFVVLRCGDSACMNHDVNMFVYIANGTTFVPAPNLTGDPASVGTLDTLNMDARPDLITLDFLDDELQVFMNAGGALPATTPVSVPISPAGMQPNGMALRDIDSIGGPEIAITHQQGTDAVAIMSAAVDGVISPATSVVVGTPQYAPNLLDIDNDGTIDLVVDIGPLGDRKILVARGSGTGAFDAPLPIVEDARIGLQMQIDDLDGDGAFDVAIRSTEATGILLLMSNP